MEACDKLRQREMALQLEPKCYRYDVKADMTAFQPDVRGGDIGNGSLS